MPTEEERAEMRALDAKLDAIAAKLKAKGFAHSRHTQTPHGGRDADPVERAMAYAFHRGQTGTADERHSVLN